jgi:predicted RNA binding protein YcfA (HicA-like mRNA interferase family)
MGKRRFPPLKRAQVIAILTNLGFTAVRHGDHECWERQANPSLALGPTNQRRLVPVGDYDEFDQTLLKRMIRETGFTRDQFYGACKDTAKKI